MWQDVPFARQWRPIVGVLRMCWLSPGSFDCFCCPRASVHRPSITRTPFGSQPPPPPPLRRPMCPSAICQGITKLSQLEAVAKAWHWTPDDQAVCVTKKFLLPGTDHLELTDLCVDAGDLYRRLQGATVHWLVVRPQPAMQLSIQHYNMAFCLQLERQYREGLHVVERASPPAQVNLDLMVEVSTKDGRREVRKVRIRCPSPRDSGLCEALLLRSSIFGGSSQQHFCEDLPGEDWRPPPAHPFSNVTTNDLNSFANHSNAPPSPSACPTNALSNKHFRSDRNFFGSS